MTVMLKSLGELLLDPESYPPSLRLYMSFHDPWSLESECVLSDESDAERTPADRKSVG